jgi:transcriptional antiterminator NusG
MNFRWYVVHTYSGFENRVKVSLQERIQAAGMQDYFTDVLIPEEDVVELVSGEKKTSKRKFFPGYILVRMEMNDETWHIVKGTPKVTGFIGVRISRLRSLIKMWKFSKPGSMRGR